MKKLWIAFLLLVLLLAVAGIVSAEETIQVNTQKTVEITIPRDVVFYEFTPSADGYYRFYSGPWGENEWYDTMGYLLDEDRQLIQMGTESNDGGFTILHRLNAGETYYYAAAFYGYMVSQTGSFPVRLDRIDGIYAEAKRSVVYTRLGQPGTAEVEAYSINPALTYQWYDGENAISGATGSKYQFPALTEAKTFTCVISDGTTTATVAVEARIDSGLTVSGSGKTSVEYNGSTTLTVQATASYGQDQLTYQWYEEYSESRDGEYWWDTREFDGETHPTITLNNITQNMNVFCEVKDINENTYNRWFYIAIPGGIRLEAVGQREREVTPGSSITLEVTATSDYPVSYQWYRLVYDDNGYDRRITIPGATSSSLALENVQASGRYSCQARNTIGNGTSIEFNVTASGAFSAAADGEEEITVPSGQNATMKVNAHGFGSLSYQWYFYNQAIERTVPLKGEVSDTLTGALRAGNYYCMVTDEAGNKGTVWFGLTVENNFSAAVDPSMGEGQDAELLLTPGETKTLKVRATGNGGIIYRWYRTTDDVYREIIEGARTDSLTVTGNEQCSYECIVTDSCGNTEWIYFYIRINNEFSVTAAKTSYTVNPGDPVRLSVTGSCTEGSIIYQWSRYDPNSYSDYIIKESTESFLDIPQIDGSNYGDYRLYAYDEFGNSRNIQFHISVENHLSAEANGPASVTVAPGGTVTFKINASCDAGESTLTYKWYGQDWHIRGYSWNWSQIPGETQSTLQLTANKSRQYYCDVLDEFGGKITISFSVKIGNNLRAYAKDNKDTFTIIPGQTVTMEVVASGASGITYQWCEENPGYGCEKISGATEAIYTTPALNKAKRYLCVVCDPYDNAVTVWIDVEIDNAFSAEALNDEDSFRVQTGETATMQVAASCRQGELTYQWYRRVPPEESGYSWWYEETLTGATGDTYTTPAITKAEQYYCRVSDMYGNSEDVWFSVHIENNLTVTSIGSKNRLVELGSDVELAVTAECTTGELTYKWYEGYVYEEDDENWWYDYSNTVVNTGSSYTIQNVSQRRAFRCEVSDEYGNEESIEFTISIDNGLRITGSFKDDPAMFGEPATLQVIARCKTGGLTYRWYKYSDEEEDYIRIQDAAEAVYTTEALTELQAEYRCIVLDNYRNSTSVHFTLYADTGLTAIPDGRSIFSINETPIILAVNAENRMEDSELSYHWYDPYYNEIEGADESTYALTNPETGSYYCEVSDESQSRTVRFYITEASYAMSFGDSDRYVDLGEEVTLQVEAWCADGEITYQWYDEDDTIIEGATNPSYTFIADSNRNPYCHVSGTGLDRNVSFRVHVKNSLFIETNGLSRIHMIPEDGDIQLTASAVSRNDVPLTYQWYLNNTELSGQTGNTLTVTEGGRYDIRVRDPFGSEDNETFYCIKGQPAAVSAGSKVTGPESGVSIYQFIPTVTGMYEIETEGWVSVYRPNQWDSYLNLGYETQTTRLTEGQIYYAVLDDPDDSFKVSIQQEEQTAYTITLLKGQNVRIPSLYLDNEWINFSHAVSNDRNVIRINSDRMYVQAEGSTDVTVTYDNGMKRIYHITVVTAANTVILPAGLQTIEEDAFNGNTSIRFIRLGPNVQEVYSGAFANVGDINVMVENPDTWFSREVFTNSNPVVICYDGNAAWCCRNYYIPFFLLNN